MKRDLPRVVHKHVRERAKIGITSIRPSVRIAPDDGRDGLKRLGKGHPLVQYPPHARGRARVRRGRARVQQEFVGAAA